MGFSCSLIYYHFVFLFTFSLVSDLSTGIDKDSLVDRSVS